MQRQWNTQRRRTPQSKWQWWQRAKWWRAPLRRRARQHSPLHSASGGAPHRGGGTTVPVRQQTQSDAAAVHLHGDGLQGLQSTLEMATPAQGDGVHAHADGEQSSALLLPSTAYGARPHADGAHTHLPCPPLLGDGVQTNADGEQSSAPLLPSGAPGTRKRGTNPAKSARGDGISLCGCCGKTLF